MTRGMPCVDVTPAGQLAQRIAYQRRRLRTLLPAILSGALLLTVVLTGLLAPAIAPHNPVQQKLTERLKPPAWLNGGTPEHLLGTDQVGRDVLSRVIYGARVSLLIGFSAVTVSGALGVGLGLFAGYRGGLPGQIIMGLADLQNAFPFIVLAIAIVSVQGSTLINLIITLAVWGWVSYARVVRAEVLSVKQREFVEAARSLGAGHLRTVWRHVLPSILPTAIVLSTFQIGQLVIAESSLSFLGLGVQPPTPSWGSMLADGRAHLGQAWWIAGFPGLAILLLVLAVNTLGDALRDWIDPRTRR